MAILDQSSPQDIVARLTGEGIARNLPGGLERATNRNMLQSSLDEVSKLAKSGNTNPIDLSLGLMKAGAGIPGSERYIGQILPQILELARAQASQGVDYTGQGQAQQSARDRTPLEPLQKGQPLQSFMGQQENPFFPSNQGPNEAPGNLPQAATAGQVRPIRTREEMIPNAKVLSKQMTDQGIPTTVQQAYEILKSENEENKLYNQEVEAERQRRELAQLNYGQKAQEQLEKVYPGASPEMVSIIRKKGEEAAGRMKSEADIDRYLGNEAKNLANTVASVKQNVSAPRLQNKIQRGFLGTNRDFEQSANDLRLNLKPLLDLGLFDESRKLLQGLGYYPEERETVINPLSEHEKNILNTVPAIKTEKNMKKSTSGPGLAGLGLNIEKERINPQNIKDVLLELKKSNPNFDLLLARKSLEDKGYDWSSFKDALNDLVLNEGFKLEDDQRIQKDYLNTPPLNNLERLLHGIGIIGR